MAEYLEKPVLLDETGHDINSSLGNISEASRAIVDRFVPKLEAINTSIEGLRGNSVTNVISGTAREPVTQGGIAVVPTKAVELGDYTEKIYTPITTLDGRVDTLADSYLEVLGSITGINNQLSNTYIKNGKNVPISIINKTTSINTLLEGADFGTAMKTSDISENVIIYNHNERINTNLASINEINNETIPEEERTINGVKDKAETAQNTANFVNTRLNDEINPKILEISSGLNNKQNKLVAGEAVTIVDDTSTTSKISVNYASGSGLSLDSNNKLQVQGIKIWKNKTITDPADLPTANIGDALQIVVASSLLDDDSYRVAGYIYIYTESV